MGQDLEVDDGFGMVATASAAGRSDAAVATGTDTAVVVLLGALAVALVGQGGYHRPAGTVVVALVAAAAVIAGRRRLGRWRDGVPASIGLAALAAAAVVTAVVDGHPGGLVAPVGLISAALAAAAVTASADGDGRRQLWDGVSVLGAAVGATGIVGVALRIGPLASVAGGLWRAATTVTYANASAAILVILALGVLARLVVAPDVTARIVAALLLGGLGATLCRAGFGTLAIGLVVLSVLLGARRVTAATIRPALGAAVIVAGLVPGMPASHAARPVPAFAGLAVGLAVAAAPWPRRLAGLAGPAGTRATQDRPARHRALLVVCAAAAAAPGVAVWLVARHSPLWSGRVGLSSPDRGGVAAAALTVWRHHLLTGVGPGRGVFVWTQATLQTVLDRYAHDEYLQLAAEEGAVGLAGGALALVGVTVTVRRGVRRGLLRGRTRDAATHRTGLSRQLTAGSVACAGAAAGVTAFGLHRALDFLWHVPGVVLVAAVALGLASPRPDSGPGAGDPSTTSTTTSTTTSVTFTKEQP